MSEHPTPGELRPRLHESFDEAGREWLDEIVRVFNDGGYAEARDAYLSDEAAVHNDADG